MDKNQEEKLFYLLKNNIDIDYNKVIKLLNINLNDEFINDLIKSIFESCKEKIYHPNKGNLDYEEKILFFIEQLKLILNTKKSSNTVCLPEWFVHKYKEQCSLEFSEGSLELNNLLKTFLNYDINTVACCAGHKIKGKYNKEPYIAIEYNEKSLATINKLLSNINIIYFKNIVFSKDKYFNIKVTFYPYFESNKDIEFAFLQLKESVLSEEKKDDCLVYISNLFYELCRVSSDIDDVEISVKSNYPYILMSSFITFDYDIEEYFDWVSLEAFNEFIDWNKLKINYELSSTLKNQINKIYTIMKTFNDNIGLKFKGNCYSSVMQQHFNKNYHNNKKDNFSIVTDFYDVTEIMSLIDKLKKVYISIRINKSYPQIRYLYIYDYEDIYEHANFEPLKRYIYSNNWYFDTVLLGKIFSIIREKYQFDYYEFSTEYDLDEYIESSSKHLLTITGINSKYIFPYVDDNKKRNK